MLGSVDAIKDLDLRIGDGRTALDAVNGYREKQVLWFFALSGLAALVVIAIIALFIAIRVLT